MSVQFLLVRDLVTKGISYTWCCLYAIPQSGHNIFLFSIHLLFILKADFYWERRDRGRTILSAVSLPKWQHGTRPMWNHQPGARSLFLASHVCAGTQVRGPSSFAFLHQNQGSVSEDEQLLHKPVPIGVASFSRWRISLICHDIDP